jgi:hypothetical protein
MEVCIMKKKNWSGTGTAYPSGAPEFTPGFDWGSCYSVFSFICMFYRSLFVLLYFWSLCCFFFFELRILIVPLISSYILMVILLTDTTNNDNNKKIKL